MVDVFKFRKKSNKNYIKCYVKSMYEGKILTYDLQDYMGHSFTNRKDSTKKFF